MELIVKRKGGGAHFKCLPGFINLFNDWRFAVRECYNEVYREMEFYDVYIKPDDQWVDFIYAFKEGFLEPSELRSWP